MITGSYLEARQNGNLGDSWISVKESKVCQAAGQIGVFTATGPFAQGTALTWYTAYLRRSAAVGCKNAFTMEGPKSKSGAARVLVGVRQLQRLQGRGVAQLANDALCIRLTRMSNNCDFIESDKVVYLVTSRDIASDDELLVHYGWRYWSEERCMMLPESYRPVMRQHRALANALQERYGILVGNCVHSDAGQDEEGKDDRDDGDENLFDIVSFDVVSFDTVQADGQSLFGCPATGVFHDRPDFLLECDIVDEKGMTMWSSSPSMPSDDGGEARSSFGDLVSRFLNYFYVCRVCSQRCSNHFLRIQEHVGIAV